MTRISWYAVALAGAVGGALAALVQWWPVPPDCAGCGGCVCPTTAVAGTVTVAGVSLGVALGAAIASAVQWLAVRDRQKRREYGEL